MNNLINVTNQNGSLVVSSRAVARDFEKRNSEVNRAIENHMETLKNTDSAKLHTLFIENEYTTEGANGVKYKEYLLTRDGFSLLVMGFTGSKALEWKLKYIEAFNKMEQEIKNNQVLTQNLSPQLQLLINMELKQREIEMAITETKQEIQGMRDVITLNPQSWRKETTTLINKIALNLGGYDQIKIVREETYKLLDQRFGVDLKKRLTNKRRRLADEGISKSKRDNVTVIDVIADDKKLIEGYVAIVKEMAIKYGA